MSFMEAAVDTGIATGSKDYWDKLEQGFIDGSWDNSTQIATGLKKQFEIGSTIDPDDTGYKPMQAVEAWHVPTLDVSGTAYYRTDTQAIKFLFRNIHQKNLNGLYYYWNNNYWLSYFEYTDTTYQSFCVCVRCDNELKFKDPIDNQIYSWPCRVNNEANNKTHIDTKYIMAPTNVYSVEVQRNEQTERIFRLNRRFLIGGGGNNDNLRAFKIIGIQNSHKDYYNQSAGILYLNLELDELQDDDDLENGIAYNADVKDIPEELNVFVFTPRPDTIRQNVPSIFKVSLTVGRTDFVLKATDAIGLEFKEIDTENHICQITSSIIGTCKFTLTAYEPSGPGIIVAPETIIIESKSMIG